MSTDQIIIIIIIIIIIVTYIQVFVLSFSSIVYSISRTKVSPGFFVVPGVQYYVVEHFLLLQCLLFAYRMVLILS